MSEHQLPAAGAGHPATANHPAGVWPLAKRIGDIAVAAIFAAVFVVFIYKIVMRYAFHDAVVWADEVSVVLFIWLIFCGNAFVIEERRQIRFDLVYRMLPERGRRIASIVQLSLVGGLFLWGLPGVIDYIQFLWRERTPALGWRLDYVYACFGIFVAAMVVRAIWGIVSLMGSGWRRHV
jgi:TRAP-type C4-dicarboxylate transport system permease small subunit